MTGNGHEAIIKVEHLEKRFPVSAGLFRKPKSFVHAVDDLNFEIPQGSSLGLVGESGLLNPLRCSASAQWRTAKQRSPRC